MQRSFATNNQSTSTIDSQNPWIGSIRSNTRNKEGVEDQCWGGRSSVGELQVCKRTSHGEDSCPIVEWSSDLNGWDAIYR